jgi:hypothetical protein
MGYFEEFIFHGCDWTSNFFLVAFSDFPHFSYFMMPFMVVIRIDTDGFFIFYFFIDDKV